MLQAVHGQLVSPVRSAVCMLGEEYEHASTRTAQLQRERSALPAEPSRVGTQC